VAAVHAVLAFWKLDGSRSIKNTAAESSSGCLLSSITGRAVRMGMPVCIQHMQAVLYPYNETQPIHTRLTKRAALLVLRVAVTAFLAATWLPYHFSAARQTTRVWSNQDSNRQRFGGMGRHSTPYGGSSVHNVGKPHGLCLVFIRSARPCSGAKGMVDIVAAPAREYIYEPLSMLNLSPTSCNLPRSARQELIYS
jgi:hypothetical protein